MKEIFSGINNLLKTLAANKGSRIWFILMLLAVSGAFYFYFNRTLPPAKKDQCDYLMEQNRQLVDALLMVKKDLSNLSKPISFNEDNQMPNYSWDVDYKPNRRIYFINSAGIEYDLTIDTIPNKKVQQQIKRINTKIDSVLLKNKKILDSLDKSKSKKQST